MRNFFTRNSWQNLLIFSSILLYILSLIIVFLDVNFTYRYASFWIRIISLILVLPPFLSTSISKTTLKNALQKKEVIIFGLVLILIGMISLILIKDYPFVSFKDEVRDGGLNAMQIANGTLKNLFGYGSYNGHGLIIPTFSSFFYQIFGSSVLTYRVPSLIIACFDVMLLYLLLRLSVGRLAAIIGSATLALLPHHIFFARTELVLVFDSFLTTVIFFAFYIWQKRRSVYDYILLGTVLGLAANFHTPARVVSLLILALVIFIELKSCLMRTWFKNSKESVRNILILILFCFVGFGPMIFFTSAQAFFQSNRSIYSKDVYIINYAPSQNRVETAKDNYIKSIKVWYQEGTTSRYPAHTPLLTPLLAILFLIGLIYAIFILKEPFFRVLVLFIFIIPFTNSAITDWLNADHRLAPLFPLAAIFVALGTKYIADKIKNDIARTGFVALILMYLVFQTYQFFTLMPANLGKDIKDYLTMHILYLLQSDEFKDAKNVCIVSSPESITTMNYAHSREAFEYFTNGKLVEAKQDTNIRDNEAYVFKRSCPADYKSSQKLFIVRCSAGKSLFCPVNYPEDIIIHY